MTGAGDVLDRHLGINPVLVEQVDPVGPQPLQHLVDDGADVLGSAVEPAWVELEAELGGQHHLVADRFQRLSDEDLVGEGSVRLRGVEERHPLLVGAADQLDAVVGVDRVAVVGAEAHAAQPDG